MALGQFVIYLIPEQWALKNNFNANLLYDKDNMFDTDYIWENNQPKLNIKIYFSKFLPKYKSWSSHLLCFGKETGHDIQVDIEENKVLSIQIRIDLTQDIKTFVNNLLIISNELKCVYFYPELKIISEPSKKELFNSIKQSNSFKYIENPNKFFYNLQLK